MSLLEGPGDLAEVPLAAVLLDMLNRRATGVLTVEHGAGASRLFVRDGVPVGAQSFGGFRPLGQALLAAGAIDVDALGQSLAEMARSGRHQGEILVEMGVVTPEQVDQALAEQQGAYLTEIASLASGHFSFDAVAPIPAWTRGIRVSPLKAIVDALETSQASPLVASALQPVASGPIALAPGYDELAAAFGWSGPEAELVHRLHEPTTLEAFFTDPGIAPERARAVLTALLLLGVASGRDAHADAVETVPGVVVDLADVAGIPIEPETLSWPEPPAAPAARPSQAPSAAPPGAPSQPLAPAPDRDETLPGFQRDETLPGFQRDETLPGGQRDETLPGVHRDERGQGAAPPKRRSDPDEARRRRQRLLLRAMQNMGVGPLSGNPPPGGRPAAHPPGGGSSGACPAATPAEEELRRALQAALTQSRSADLFERLGVPRSSTRDQVKAAYFLLAKQLHPDRFGSPALADLGPRVKDVFTALNEAYEVLSDDRKRSDYLARTGAGTPSAAKATDREAAAQDFQKAEACARTRDFAKARVFYEAALRAEPNAEYQAAYAWMLLQDPRGDRGRARSLAESALREPSPPDRAAVVCAILARDEGDDAKAERLLRKALQSNPRNADAERELRALESRREKPKPSGLGGLFRKR
jgi:curved DNA-binding protein CbpA